MLALTRTGCSGRRYSTNPLLRTQIFWGDTTTWSRPEPQEMYHRSRGRTAPSIIYLSGWPIYCASEQASGRRRGARRGVFRKTHKQRKARLGGASADAIRRRVGARVPATVMSDEKGSASSSTTTPTPTTMRLGGRRAQAKKTCKYAGAAEGVEGFDSLWANTSVQWQYRFAFR